VLPRIARQGGVLVGNGDLFFLDQPVQAAGHRLEAALTASVGDIHHHHAHTRQGADLRDAVTHGAGADDADVLNCHAVAPCCVDFLTCCFVARSVPGAYRTPVRPALREDTRLAGVVQILPPQPNKAKRLKHSGVWAFLLLGRVTLTFCRDNILRG
jgi:hypothetical protein